MRDSQETSISKLAVEKSLTYFSKPLWSFLVAAIAWLTLASLIVFVFLYQQSFFFRDYSIIWEGAYRLTLGQIPYRDFGMPMGPVSLLLPALGFKFFGANFITLKGVAIVLALVDLLCMYQLVRSLHQSILVSYLTAASFVFSYLLQTSYPWYNTTALAVELLALWPTLASLQSQRIKAWHGYLAGFLTFLCLFTKQDYGVFCLLICSLFWTIKSIRTRSFKPICHFLLGAFIPLSLFLLWATTTDFYYWFNFGQSYQAQRSVLDALLASFRDRMAIGLVATAVWFGFILWRAQTPFKEFIQTHPFILLLFSTALFVQSLVTAQTSGLGFLHGAYGLAPLGLLALASVAQPKSGKIFRILSMVLWLALLRYGSNHLGWRLLEVSATSAETLDVALSEIPQNQVNTNPESAIYDQYLSNTTWEAVQKLKDLKIDYSKPCPVLNMTELTPLAKDLNFVPCKGLPLWYHDGVSFFQPDIDKLHYNIENRNYSLVLIQGTHTGWDQTFKALANHLEERYIFVTEFASAAGTSHILVFRSP